MSSGDCRVCSIGHFSIGNHSKCTPCMPGTFQNQSTSSSCFLCPALTSSFQAASSIMQCVCARGYEFNASLLASCQSCVPGSFKSVTSHTIACRTCPANSNSPPSGVRDRCICNAGYRDQLVLGQQAICAPCPPGSYNTLPDSVECQLCSANTYKTSEGHGKCTACMNLSSSNPGATQQSECVCDFGSSIDANGTCRLCEPGTTPQTSEDGLHTCVHCVQGTWKSDFGLGGCHPCSEDSTCGVGAVHVGACVCIGGYYRSSNNKCVACDAGFFSTFAGFFRTAQPQPDDCVRCETDTYNADEGRENCTLCPASTTTNQIVGATASNQCICKKGTTRVNGSCEPCPNGTFASEPGDNECNSCYFEHSVPNSDRTSCVCDRGYYGDHECTACPVANTVSAIGSSSVDACECDAGFAHKHINGATVCEICPVGKYKMHASTLECLPCEAGKFKSSTGRGHCTVCSLGKFSVHIAADSSTVCTSCESGSYSTSPSENACVTCSQLYSSVELTNAFNAGIASFGCVDFIRTSVVV